MLEIELFGGLRFVLDGVALKAPGSARAQSLLAYLALHRDRALPRPYLAGLFWPDSSTAQSRTNLRRVLHELRQGLSGSERFIDFDGPALQWRATAPCLLDVERFEGALEDGSRRALEMAVALYGGDLLPDCYDDWILPQRERLRQAYGAALGRLADLLEGAREYRAAAVYIRRLLLHEPLHEATYRRLMRLEALAGNPGGVQCAYRDCAAALRDELGVEPSQPTRELADRLTASPAAVPAADAPGGRRAPPVPTIGAALRAQEQTLFVGRGRELVRFRTWLESGGGTAPSVLNVHGPGGVGKSTLLRAFEGIARRLGWQVVLADGCDVPPTPAALLAVLAPVPADQAVAYLNEVRPLLLLDACERLGELNRWLVRSLLPGLNAAVRVVVAGRCSAAHLWGHDTPCGRTVASLPLAAFTPEEGREYLRRRGLTDPLQQAHICEATGGNPLALALAADLMLSGEARDLREVPEWRFAVRDLADLILRDVRVEGGEDLRAPLDACSVLRRFDQSALGAVSGLSGVAPVFERLCRLSVVRPSERGLALHEDVRRILSEDLRWRDPERHTRLRLRAAAHYRRRMRDASPADREWLATDCLFLLGPGPVQALVFQEAPPEGIALQAVRPADHADVRRMWTDWVTQHQMPAGELRPGLEAALAYPGARLRIARSRDGRALGFSGTLPICRESLPILAASPTTRTLARHCCTTAERDGLPADAGGATAFVLRYLVETDRHAEAVRAALLADMLSLLGRGGTYFVTTPRPAFKELAEALGFRRLEHGRDWTNGTACPVEVYELDLSDIGFDAWLEGTIRGRAVPQPHDPVALEREVASVLVHWRDDAWLARSRLLRAAPSGPRAVREAVLRAVREVRGEPGEVGAACRAIEVAYLGGETLTAGEAACRLGVSRATFYRWVKRGVRALAAAPSLRGGRRARLARVGLALPNAPVAAGSASDPR